MAETPNMNELKFPCVIPTIADDYERTKFFFNNYFELLPIDEIVLIGPESLREHVNKDVASGFYNDKTVSFLAETDLVPFDRLIEIYAGLLAKTTQPNPSSINWYYQQFLKMAYSLVCKADYYLCWDSDTIPLKKINMFSESGKPYFDTKTELNPTYFVTIERLFGFNKIIEKSFISEHMLFSRQFMQEMIEDIKKTPYDGEEFYEKILYSLKSDNLVIGFSEFETYGTWVGMHHPSAYILRNWKSFRNTNFFVDVNDLTPEDIEWLAGSYQAATFERYQETEDVLTRLFRTPRYREKLTAEQFFISVLESGALGEYSDGTIKHDGLIAPI